MAFYAGIDCGTQGTKVVIIDTEKTLIAGEGSAPHAMISDSSGRREQRAEWWVDALCAAFAQAVAQAGITADAISAIAVSGQQHGLVPLDAEGNVLRPVKLWCDTETAPENDRLLAQLGGIQGSIDRLGLMVATGYTASKLVWLREQHPELWERLDSVLLPHDYLNYWLTGAKTAEYGDASGTGLFDVRTRTWNKAVVDLIDDSGRLWNALPPLRTAETVIGTVTAAAARRLNLNPATRVATGGGDNMMGAIGTGNIRPGTVTMSLGTSGALYAYASKPIAAASEMIANFCSSNNGWLPLICTMNATSATSTIQHLFNQDLVTFNQMLENSAIGAGGITMLPFFNGERIPPLPQAKASLHHLDSTNCTQPNICRAVVESATFGMRYGLDLFRREHIEPTTIRLIGGGAKSPLWRQIVADVMDCEVICPMPGETAALGAAIQAAWSDIICRENVQAAGRDALLEDLCRQYVVLDEKTKALPVEVNRQNYQQVYSRYLDVLTQQYPQGGV